MTTPPSRSEVSQSGDVEECDRASPRTWLYVAAPWVMVRAPLLAASEAKLADDPRLALADPKVTRALAMGSMDLLNALEREGQSTRDVERAERSLARYLKRMSTRPTPYGGFASVSLARWGSTTDLELDERCPTRTRPDMAWVGELLGAVEKATDPPVGVQWRADPFIYEHAGRWHSMNSGNSVRATEAVSAALRAATCWTDSIDLRERIMGTPAGGSLGAEEADRLLERLRRSGFLEWNLTPVITGQRATSGAGTYDLLSRAAPAFAAEVETLLAKMAAVDSGADSATAEDYLELDSAAHAIVPSSAGPRFQTDQRRLLAGDRINSSIGRDLAETVELLLRIGPVPAGSADLDAYSRRFGSRFGEGHPVPLLSVLDPIRGLGPFPHSHGSSPGISPEVAARRNDTLMALALGALRDARTSVMLDDATIASLQTWRPKAANAPLSLDVAAFVVAEDSHAVDRGDYRVVIGPNLGASSAGRWLGRFGDLFPEATPQYYRWLAEAETLADPARALPAEVVYRPAMARLANVVLRPVVSEREIVISGQGGAPISVDPADLQLSVHEGRLELSSGSTGQRLRPTARHMLNTHAAPSVCHLFDEMSRRSGPELMGFDWGAAESLPFTPRVEWGRVVLRPARWRVNPEWTAGGTSVRAAQLERAVELARTRWGLPQRVYVSSADNRLLLDLDRSDDFSQLLREAGSAGPSGLRLDEALPDIDDAWLPGPGGSYLSEVVVSLVRRPVEASVREIERIPHQIHPEAGARPIVPTPGVGQRLKPPGSDWLFAKFYAPYEQLTALLTGPLSELIDMAETSGLTDRWFFIRYGDPEPHLRLRWQGAADVLVRHLLPQVVDFGRGLLDRGQVERVALDTYEREIERYGGVAGVRISEEVFCADSRFAIKLLSLPGIDLTNMLTLSTMALLEGLGISVGRSGDDVRQMLRRLTDDEVRKRAGEDYRDRKVALRALATEDPAFAQPTTYDIFRRYRSELSRCAEEYRAAEAEGVMDSTLAELVPSLIHMHHNRLAGPNASPAEGHIVDLVLRTRQGLDLSRGGRGSAVPAG